MKRINFIFLVFVIFLFANTVLAQKSIIKTIVLDAGHGGKDPGALGTGRYEKTEKDIALDVTLKLGNYLEKYFSDLTIIYTRKGDTFPTLKDRTDLANNSKADLFISIHCDSFTKSSAKGSSSHVMGLRYTEANLRVAQKENSVIYLEDNYLENYNGFDPNSPESIIAFSLSQTTHLNHSILIAQKIQEQFKKRVNRVDRGVKQTPLWVTRATSMPSVLIELGFISNNEEEDFLNSEIGQDYMASAIYRAIKEYKNDIESSNLKIKSNIISLDTDSSTKFENLKKTKEKDVIFKVQISTSLNLKKMNNLDKYKVEVFMENNIFKYTIGNESQYESAIELKKVAKENGFNDAFIIAFLNNKKIKISEAINYLKK